MGVAKCVILIPLVVGLMQVPRTWAEPERHLRSPFKVAVFADLHFGENAWTQWGPKQDLNSLRVMSNVLDAEAPDLVVYLGDLITANNIPIANASMYWDLATSPARERGIPWTSIFGNHDDAPFIWPVEWFSASGIPPVNCSSAGAGGEQVCGFTGTTRMELMEHEIASNPRSLTQPGPMNLWPSLSNYALHISSSDDPHSPLAFFYFLDSGGGTYPQVISKAQADWFQSKSQEINPDSRYKTISRSLKSCSGISQVKHIAALLPGFSYASLVWDQ